MGIRGRKAGVEGAGRGGVEGTGSGDRRGGNQGERERGREVFQISERVRHAQNPNAKLANKKLFRLCCDT